MIQIKDSKTIDKHVQYVKPEPWSLRNRHQQLKNEYKARLGIEKVKNYDLDESVNTLRSSSCIRFYVSCLNEYM